MRVVIDTNVIVSALLTPTGTSARILEFISNNIVTIIFDNRIMTEYLDVFYRDELNLDKEMLNKIINFINKKGKKIIASPIKTPFTDETDKKFYEVYKTGMADYLVTGNIKHFPKEPGIVTPREFIEIISG